MIRSDRVLKDRGFVRKKLLDILDRQIPQFTLAEGGNDMRLSICPVHAMSARGHSIGTLHMAILGAVILCLARPVPSMSPAVGQRCRTCPRDMAAGPVPSAT